MSVKLNWKYYNLQIHKGSILPFQDTFVRALSYIHIQTISTHFDMHGLNPQPHPIKTIFSYIYASLWPLA